MTELEELQNKPSSKRTRIEQCIVDAATFEEAEHDGEIEPMENAATDLKALVEAARLVVRRRDVGELLKAIDRLDEVLKQVAK